MDWEDMPTSLKALLLFAGLIDVTGAFGFISYCACG